MALLINTGDAVRDRMIGSLLTPISVSGNFAVCSDKNTSVIGEDITSAIIIVCGEDAPLPDIPSGVDTVFLGDPFPIEELLRAAERLFTTHGICGTDDHAVFSRSERLVTFGNKSVTFSPKEAELFLLLLSGRGKPLSLSEVYDKLWRDSRDSNVAGVYFTYIRRKLSSVFGEGAVVNVRGRGYMLRRDITDIKVVM